MSFQAYLDNIQAKTGKPPEEIVGCVRAQGLSKPPENFIRGLNVAGLFKPSVPSGTDASHLRDFLAPESRCASS